MKSKIVQVLFLLVFNLVVVSCIAQVTGDYRTRSGATTWNSATSWQRFNGTAFVDYATPPSVNFIKKITVMHSITFNLVANVASLEIKDGATLTLTQNLTISSELSLTSGQLNINGLTLTIADGCYLIRAGGSLSSSPTFDATVNVIYNENATEIETSYELPTNTSALVDLEIWSTNGVKLMQNVTVNNAMYLYYGQLNLNSNALTMGESTTIFRSGGSLSATPTFGTTVNVTYNEHTAEITSGSELPSSTTVLNNLIINNSMNVALANDVTVNGTMDFTAGKFIIGNNDLTIASAGSITNYTSDNYIVAGSTFYNSSGGKLIRFVNSGTSAADQTFPIGTSTSYTPCYISNSNATGTNYNVNLFNPVLENGNDGIEVTGGVLKRTWHITAATPANAEGSTTVKVQWVGSDEGLDFVNTSTLSLIRNAGAAPSAWEASSGTFSSDITDPAALTMDAAGITNFADYPFFTGKGGELSTGGVLPISLVEFKTECNKGKQNLVWTTATEINNDFFTIEKSNDAKNWEVLGMIPGSGNSNELLTYNLLDRNENKGMGYYRLKQTDFNGTSAYSKIITSENCSDFAEIPAAVFPNPFDNSLNLTFNANGYGVANISVFDVAGKSVYRSDYIAKEGFNSSSIDLKTLPNGVYYLKFDSGDKSENFKIMKQ